MPSVLLDRMGRGLTFRVPLLCEVVFLVALGVTERGPTYLLLLSDETPPGVPASESESELGAGLRGGVGVSWCELKPESWEIRF